MTMLASGLAFLSSVPAEVYVMSGLGGRYCGFRLPVTWDRVQSITIAKLVVEKYPNSSAKRRSNSYIILFNNIFGYTSFNFIAIMCVLACVRACVCVCM